MDLKDGGEECSLEYVEVADGTGGAKKFCGKNAFTSPFKPNKGLRDLFVKFHSANEGGGSRKGFKCEVKCSANAGKYLFQYITESFIKTCFYVSFFQIV